MHADTPTACENCGAVLQGAFCHACGQNAHNPLRNIAHAIEDVFESFWHLDGRVFRTLRDLLLPGRVACNYLAGQRVRYIPPLRLFVVLTVLTFFVGRLVFADAAGPGVVRIGTGADGQEEVRVDRKPGSTFADAATVEEVVRRRDEALEGLAEGRRAVGAVPIAAQGMERAEAKVRADADTGVVRIGTGADGQEEVRVDRKPGSTFADAATVEEVVRRRDEALEGLAEGRRAVGAVPIAAQGMERAEAKVRADAEIRIAQLRAAGAGAAPA
ncbi:MAG TPA: DUF3667 domain-containing protein, partial [Lysobacter sp.]